jgi:hypothetical protein
MGAERGGALAPAVNPSTSAPGVSNEAFDRLSRSRGTSLTDGEGGFEGEAGGGGLCVWGECEDMGAPLGETQRPSKVVLGRAR